MLGGTSELSQLLASLSSMTLFISYKRVFSYFFLLEIVLGLFLSYFAVCVNLIIELEVHMFGIRFLATIYPGACKIIC